MDKMNLDTNISGQPKLIIEGKNGTIEIPVLDMGAEDFCEKFLELTGIQPGETIQITTPTFDRVDDVKPIEAPSRELFENLHLYEEDDLRKMGLVPFDINEDGRMLWLFPGEWFEYIPLNFMVTDIFWKTEPFIREAQSDDTYYGMLAYGIVR